MPRKSALNLTLIICFFVTLLTVAQQTGSGRAQAEEKITPIYLPVTIGNTGGPAKVTDYDALFEQNVEAGIWSYEEGLVTLLKFLVNEKSRQDIPGIFRVTAYEGTGLVRRASDYIVAGPDEEVKVELERLLRALLPPLENIRYYSQPNQTTANRGIEEISDLAMTANAAVCVERWEDGFPIVADLKAECFKEESFKVNNKSMTIFMPPAHLDKIAVVKQGIKDSVETYDKYGVGQTPRITIVVSVVANENEAGYAFDKDWRAGNFTEPPKGEEKKRQWPDDECPITVSKEFLLELKDGDVKQLIAHEIFHCFTFDNLNLQYDGTERSDHKWWVEGAAEYFSNDVYKSNNLEHRRLDNFNFQSSRSSILKMDYENFIFFQYVANYFSPMTRNKKVIGLLKKLPTKGGEEDQAAGLNSWFPEMNRFMHDFGQDYFDGLIKDSSGQEIRSDLEPLILTPFPHTFRNKSEEKGFSADVFRLTRYSIGYEEGKIYQQSLNPNYGVIQSQRGLIDGNALVDEPWAPLPTEVRATCTFPREYFVLLTAADYVNREKEHLKPKIKNLVERDCSCYFDVQIKGRVNGLFDNPGFFIYDPNHPRLQLYFYGMGPEFGLSMEAGLESYTRGMFGNYDDPNYSLIDLRFGRTLQVNRIYPGEGPLSGLLEIDKPEQPNIIEARINGRAWVLDGFKEGFVTYTANIRAAEFLSEEANTCENEWQ